MARSADPVPAVMDTHKRAEASRPPRAQPEYIAPAEPEYSGPIYPGAEYDDEFETAPSDRPAPAPRAAAPGADLAALILRWAVGALLVVRGSQGLFGWFGGTGGVSLASQLEQLGYQSFAAEATAVAVAEVVLGVLLILGLFTEWACGALLALSVVAVLAEHRMGAGLLSDPGTGLGANSPGLEVTVGLGVLAVVLAFLGAGRLSLDRNRFWTQAPLVTAFIALVLGAAIGVVLIQPQLL